MHSSKWCFALLLWSLLACALPAAAQQRPSFVAEIDQTLADDPRAAIALAQAQAVNNATPLPRFWALLMLARGRNQLEQRDAARQALAEAEATLDGWPDATAAHRGWLSLLQAQVQWDSDEPHAARARLDALLRHAASADDARLACEVRNHDLNLLLDVGSRDEAWLAAEAVERCARELGAASLESSALHAMGHIAARGQARTQTDADAYFERAAKALGDRPSRFARSLVLWERGQAQLQAGNGAPALRHFTEAQVLSQAIDDRAGIAAANIGMAEVHNQDKQPRIALQLLSEARRLLEAQHDNGFRLATVAEHTLVALALLKRPEVLAEIARARRWDTSTAPAEARMRLARAMAGGYASQGRWAEAYAEAERAERFRAEGRSFAGDVQTLRLQARYAAAQRDAENAALRHRTETDRLALAAESATQRALWAALATLLVLAAALGALAWRTLSHRRVLADLALRDELTGQPNRRAVRAYAQAQMQQARQFGLPLTLAMIDLDHFKRVNDTLGHSGGDAVLRALAQAANAVLRGQDRLGRWGGEEWLLVMPGTSAAEAPAVFARLRARFVATAAEGVSAAHGCTFSMGAAQFDERASSLDALLAECDRQLYRAKSQGRDRLQVAAGAATGAAT